MADDATGQTPDSMEQASAPAPRNLTDADVEAIVSGLLSRGVGVVISGTVRLIAGTGGGDAT
jgi:hypothetical protein